MKFTYEVIPLREACNELMSFQKKQASITPELFDNMNFETRMLPSLEKALYNYLVAVKDGEKIVGYVYTNISPKEAYDTDFATFFDLSSVTCENVGCLSQFYLHEKYRKHGVGSVLFNLSMEWLKQFDDVEDYFIFVSNGNENALEFYKRKGFRVSHDILDGFITVLRSRSGAVNTKSSDVV
jgi:GNAT superfamily N-acetyltransferase